jgi:hypothetical protein
VHVRRLYPSSALTEKPTKHVSPIPSSAPTRSSNDRGETGARLPVSVIVPVYNRAEMLQRCLASVWSQYPAPPAEVIVIDDGSRDRTADVAKKLGARVIGHPQNRGVSAARNSGLRAASHSWIAMLDSDDEWLSHHLAHLWELRSGHVLVAGSSMDCGTDPARDRFRGPAHRRPIILRGGDQIVSSGNPIPTSGSLFLRDLALEAGGFRSYRRVVEDYDMWLRLLELGTGICSPRVTIIYHMHDAHLSQETRTMQLATLEAAEAHRQRTGGSRTPLRRWEGVVAWDNLRGALRANDRRSAFRWGLRIVGHPQCVAGLVSTWISRHFIRRRSALLRASGVGPSQRGSPDIS